MAIPRLASYAYEQITVSGNDKLNWQIDPARCVFLIHDMQNYFVDFFDRSQAPIPQLFDTISRIRSRCYQQNVPVIYTAQPRNQDPKDRALLSDFWGDGLRGEAHETFDNVVDELTPYDSDIVYTKWRYSAFQRTPLMEYMKKHGKDQLIITGIYAHIGIVATTLEAFMNDIQTFVIGDGVADFSAQDHQQALDFIAGRCGQVVKADNVLRADFMNVERLLTDVANVMQIPSDEIDADENLMYLGLDSIRLMSLVEQWRAQGFNINFADLAETTTINDWVAIFNDEPLLQANQA